MTLIEEQEYATDVIQKKKIHANTCPFKTEVYNTCTMKDHLSKTSWNSTKEEFSRLKWTHRSTNRNYNWRGKDNTNSDDENPIYYVKKTHHINHLKGE